MKRSEKILIALVATLIALSAVYLTLATIAKNQRSAALARLLAPPITTNTVSETRPSPGSASPSDTTASPSSHLPGESTTLASLLERARPILLDETLADVFKTWKREADVFTDAQWRDLDLHITPYRDLIAQATAMNLSAGHYPPISNDQAWIFDRLAYLMLIDAELAFRRGDADAGCLRLLATPLPFTLACGVIHRALPNPIPALFLDPMLERLYESDPKQNAINRIVYAAKNRAETWPDEVKTSRVRHAEHGRGWLQRPIYRSEQLLEDCFIHGPTGVLYESPLGSTLVDRDIAKYLDLQARLRDALRMPYPHALPLAQAIDREVQSLNKKHYYLVERSYIRAETLITDTALDTVRLDLPKLGILIERYRADHGQPPESLDVIANQLRKGLPTDPFSGQPYLYRPDGDRFLLYSIGPNQTDDHGDATGGRDLLWRPSR